MAQAPKRDKMLGVYVTSEMRQALKVHAAKKGTTVSTLVRAALEEILAAPQEI